MKYCLIILCIAAVCLGFHQQQPKEFIEANVVVKKGDVLQDIVYDLKQNTMTAVTGVRSALKWVN